jgi:hypothetical protein
MKTVNHSGWNMNIMKLHVYISFIKNDWFKQSEKRIVSGMYKKAKEKRTKAGDCCEGGGN